MPKQVILLENFGRKKGRHSIKQRDSKKTLSVGEGLWDRATLHRPSQVVFSSLFPYPNKDRSGRWGRGREGRCGCVYGTV